MGLKINPTLAVLAAMMAGDLSFAPMAFARVAPLIPPPPCDTNMEVCAVVDPATGKPRIWPRDVAKFQTDVETCIHFAGEEAYDKARGRQIAAAVKKHCGGAKRALPKLRGKYAGDPLVLGRVTAIQALYDSAL